VRVLKSRFAVARVRKSRYRLARALKSRYRCACAGTQVPQERTARQSIELQREQMDQVQSSNLQPQAPNAKSNKGQQGYHTFLQTHQRRRAGHDVVLHGRAAPLVEASAPKQGQKKMDSIPPSFYYILQA